MVILAMKHCHRSPRYTERLFGMFPVCSLAHQQVGTLCTRYQFLPPAQFFRCGYSPTHNARVPNFIISGIFNAG